MTLLKYVTCTAFGVLGAKIYTLLVEQHKKAIQSSQEQDDEEFTEIFFTRCSIEATSRLTKGLTFSPEKFTHTTELIGYLIESAQSTLCIAMYVFTSNSLAEKIIGAIKRGVSVLLIIDHSMEHAKHSVVRPLKAAGAYVKIYKREPATTMHQKLCLIDVPYDAKFKKLVNNPRLPSTNFKSKIALPKKNGVTITGSVNWTHSGLTSNHENFIVTSSKKVCETSAAEFFKLWNDSNAT